MIPPLIDHVSTFTISLQTLKQIFNSMQIEWKNKNRPIYYPSVCLIASNFTTDQGNLKFKGIHLPSTPLIKYLSYLFLFFSLPKVTFQIYFYHVDEDRYRRNEGNATIDRIIIYRVFFSSMSGTKITRMCPEYRI